MICDRCGAQMRYDKPINDEIDQYLCTCGMIACHTPGNNTTKWWSTLTQEDYDKLSEITKTMNREYNSQCN